MAFAIAGLSTAATMGLVTAGAGALAGGISAIGSNQRRKSRERELDEFAQQSPLYQGSKPVSEYYQQAMNRYKESPYQSLQYQIGQKNIQRATAQGLGALQDRRSAIGGISRLEASQMGAMQNLGAQSEAQRDARFSQLGGATQMKNADLMQQFDFNKWTPYNRQFGLKQMKSAAANEEYSKDVSNTVNALGNMASIGMMADNSSGVKDNVGTSSVNTNPYSKLAVNPNEFGTNFIDYSTSQSANPSAFGTSYMDFNKYRNPFKAPKGYKGY
jgi:hypothetical protein